MSELRTENAILLVEDNPGDARLFEIQLAAATGKYGLVRATTLEGALALLAQQQFAIIVLDLGLPDSQGLETFLQAHSRAHETPIIVLTGLDDDEASQRAVQAGAQDYLVKGSFDGPTLTRAIRYAIERQHLLVRLENSLKEIKILEGMLPICAACKKIRDDKGYWQQMESYIRDHSEAEFSHGLCPACVGKMRDDWRQFKGGA